ncbi:MAG TPA: M36 family metallopeptidase [Gaiellaceae bacterium]|nr:M36 family metallopeptidase [Gaiellaceae bacterium]
MSLRPPGLRLAMAAALAALVWVPGSMSASDAGEAAASSDSGAVAAALAYVSENPAELGVTSADVSDLAVTSSYSSSHNGVTHVNLNQRYQGLEVFTGHATVNVAANGRILFASGAFERDLRAAGPAEATLDAAEAVEAAAAGLDLADPTNLRILEEGDGEALVSSGGISNSAIPARLGWQPTKNGLRLAWQVTIDDSSAAHLWNAAVDAETGALLDSADWTSHDSVEDLSTLSRVGSTSIVSLATEPFPPNPVLDGSSYRVLKLPTESPNDALRQLVENPADGLASPFGWHDTNGAPGAEFTITRGNNNHAYLDQDDDEAMDFGGSPDGGAGLDFDFPADLTEHAQFYRDAVVANLFYGCNTFHDIFYRYGFDEVSGNFQANNYGRGGLEGDYVRCEAADGSGTNNANFSTPSEPTPGTAVPRMQMYLWPGNQFGRQNEVVVDGFGSFGAGWARFGPPATNAGVSGAIVLVNDGSALPTEGCNPLVGFPAGAIALVDRGTCSFQLKTQNAQAAGAVGVILADNTTSTTPPTLSGTFVNAPETIPTVSITQADGATIKAVLPASGTVRKNPAHPGIRDGDFENGIIYHEYGHGLSNRLTGGPAVNCLSGNEQAGEGWSDYVAISTMIDPALDDPQGPRGMGPYALFQPNRQGNGIRPRPYSRDMSIQPFTYDSIKSNGWLNGTSLALPHGLGHGWAAVLWDMTWDLIDRHGFNPNVYEAWNTGGNNRAIQYVIDGLKFQGCGPGLVVARAAIVAAADTLGGEDTCMVWSSFARRGLGYSAVQGTTNRNDNDEAFDTHPDCREDFTASADEPYGTLNPVNAGTVVALKFRADDYSSAEEVLKKSGGIFSRKVDCSTLRVPSEDPSFITPRERPLATVAQGQTKLALLKGGQFRYRWQTDEAWAGTCREFVLTREDGVQHRAFFSFN